MMVYPRSIDFGDLPAGVQSAPQWVHVVNYTSNPLDVSEWGINGHFVTQRPVLKQMTIAQLNELKITAPASGASQWICGYGDYIFEGNTTTGIGVFKLDSAGNASEVSRYTAVVPLATGGGLYHDGRFLYVRNADGLHVFKLDPYGNLVLTDIIKPNAVTVNDVHGYGDYIFIIDSVGITVLTVSNRGQITVVYSEALTGGLKIWARKDWVFAIRTSGTSLLRAYKVSSKGALSGSGGRQLGAGAYENLTGDQDFIYVTDDTSSNNLYSLSIDENGSFSTLSYQTLSTGTHYGLCFDGAYLQVSNGAYLDSYSVDRQTGALSKVLSTSDLGSELLADGDMEAVGVAAWTVGSSATLTKETGTPHGGIQCLRIAYNGVSAPYAYDAGILTIGKTYRARGWARGDGTFAPRCENASIVKWQGTLSTSWQYFDVIFIAVSGSVVYRNDANAAGYCEFDDCSVVEVESPFSSIYFNKDNNLVCSMLNKGLGVYNFNNSRMKYPIYYTPLGYERHEGGVSIQGVQISLKGNSPTSLNPYIKLDADSIVLKSDTRWDKITYDWFGSFDRVQDVKDANPQIPSLIKSKFYVPRGTIVKKPISTETEDSVIGAAGWRR